LKKSRQNFDIVFQILSRAADKTPQLMAGDVGKSLQDYQIRPAD